MSAPPIAPRLPGYRDLAPLGRGGYSEVFRAYQEQFDRWVAVKVLTVTLDDDGAQRRFLRECRLAGRLSIHPNIVTVYDAGIAPDGRPYLAMELFEQGSLATAVTTRGVLDVAETLRTGIALAGALETAHRAQVVHRDVKPGNVLVAKYGQPVLTDFGLSVLAERDPTAGSDALTPFHTAPELLEGGTPAPTSDVYALASTLYAVLQGRAPHEDPADPALGPLMRRIVQQDAPRLARPDVPASLSDVVAAALARDPLHRPRSALVLAHALQAVQRSLGGEITEPVVLDIPPPPPDPTPPPDNGPTAGSSTSRTTPPAPPPPPPPPAPAPAPEGEVATTATAEAPSPPPPPPPPPAADPTPPPPPAAEPSPPPPPPAAEPAPPPSAPSVEPSIAGDQTQPRQRTGTPAPPRPAQARPGDGRPDDVVVVDPPEASSPAAKAPAATPSPALPPIEPATARPAGRDDQPAWMASPAPSLGDTTIERDRLRRAATSTPLPPPAPRPAANRRGLLLVSAVVLLVVVVAGAVALVLTSGGDDESPEDEPEDSTQVADIDVPTGLTAAESDAGVQLDWEGDDTTDYVVLILSENQQPYPEQVTGPSLLIEATQLESDVGYCFAVASQAGLTQASEADDTEAAFSAPVCIRGAAEDTVLQGGDLQQRD